MPRQRNPNREKAYEIYKEHKGSITNREIANMLGEDEKKVAVWKQRDKWNVVQQKKECCTTKSKTDKKVKQKEPIESAITELENSELNDKQRLFCIYYTKYFNATKAYRKAYGCSYEVALVNGPRLLGNARVTEEIRKLKQDKLNRAFLTEDDIVQKYIDIAFADINDYVQFGQEEIPVMTMYGPLTNKETGEVITKRVNTVRFNESTDVDGTIISEVSQGRDGAKIKLYDKTKALDWLANHMDLLDTATKERLRLEQKKFELEKAKQLPDENNKGNLDSLIAAIRKSGDRK